MSTATTETKFEVGDRVRIDWDSAFAPYAGTVTGIKDGRYTVRKVEDEPGYETFTESQLELDVNPESLDIDDLVALRRELVDSATRDKPDMERHHGIFSEFRGERIRSASRIAWLATRIAWLEAGAVIKADREL